MCGIEPSDSPLPLHYGGGHTTLVLINPAVSSAVLSAFDFCWKLRRTCIKADSLLTAD